MIRDATETQLEKERDLYYGRCPAEPDDYEEQLKIDREIERRAFDD